MVNQVKAFALPTKLMAGGAVVGLISFFLPAIGSFGGSVSLAGLASHAPLLWLLPLSCIGIVVVSFLSGSLPAKIQEILPMAINTMATIWLTCSLLMNGVADSAGAFASAGIGLILSTLAFVAVVVGSYMSFHARQTTSGAQVHENVAPGP